MESPVHSRSSGWTGTKGNVSGMGSMVAPKTVERKRRGRQVDTMGILPTPPRTRDIAHLPTPETGHRRSKQKDVSEKQKQYSQPIINHLPTPETLPRPPRQPQFVSTSSNPASTSGSASTSDNMPISPPSPSGHTTFFLANSMATTAGRADKISRRRPGLTFAQQMGLMSQTGSGQSLTSTSNASGSDGRSSGNQVGSGARTGPGVGMAGARNGGHRKDQITWGRLAEPLPVDQDDNPFLVKATRAASPDSPGRSTIHLPRHQATGSDDGMTSDAPMLSPDQPRHVSKPLVPSLDKSIVTASATHTQLLSPPPTQHAPRVRVTPDFSAEAHSTKAKPKASRTKDAANRQRREQIRQMMDVEDNPFLDKPGEPSRPHQPASPSFEESPFVTYVFRGSKKTFANPFYPSSAPFPPADLHPDDDEFEPCPNPKPRLLWPTGAEKKMDLEEYESRARSVSASASPPPSTPRRRLFVTSETEAREVVDRSRERGDVEMGADGIPHHRDDDGAGGMSEDEAEVDLPARKGLLFAPGNGIKRGVDGEEQGMGGARSNKKIKAMRI